MTDQYFVAIDAGTGSVRCVLFGSDGAEVCAASRDWTHLAEEGVPGSMAFQVDRNFDLILDIVREVVGRSNVPKKEIVAISATSMREGFALVDAGSREIWACANVDARANEEVALLKVNPDTERYLYETSGQTFALAAQPRLLWLARHQPEILHRASKMVMLSEWVLLRLAGVVVMEPTNGSTSGLLSLKTRKAEDSLLTACSLPSGLVPDVVEPGTPLGRILPAVAHATGLDPRTIVVAGGGDTQLAALGTGVSDPGQSLIVGGTFWQEVVNIPQPVTDAEMRVRVNAAALPDQWQAEAIAFHVGTAVRWFRDTFADSERHLARERGVATLDVLGEEAASIPIGSLGVIPIFSDVMNYARWRHAAPSFLQLPLDFPGETTRAAMYRSLLENAAIVAGSNLGLVAEFSGLTADTVVFAGGCAKSGLWSQILADVLGVAVQVPTVKEATSQGAAICAATGQGMFGSLAEGSRAWVSWDRRFEPNLEATERYAVVKDRWRRAYAPQLALVDEGVTESLWRAPGA
jgi:autoinducer-2 kinase